MGMDYEIYFKNYDYSPDGRVKNIQSVLDLCRFLDDKGFTVVVSVVAPYKEMRDSLKSTNEMCEIYVHTSEKRGREDFFAKDYEPPTDSFIDIDYYLLNRRGVTRINSV